MFASYPWQCLFFSVATSLSLRTSKVTEICRCNDKCKHPRRACGSCIFRLYAPSLCLLICSLLFPMLDRFCSINFQILAALFGQTIVSYHLQQPQPQELSVFKFFINTFVPLMTVWPSIFPFSGYILIGLCHSSPYRRMAVQTHTWMH